MKWDLISNFVLGFILFGISMIVLQVGRNIYGGDAAVLWAMGILSYMGLMGIAGAFKPFINKKFVEQNKSAEVKE